MKYGSKVNLIVSIFYDFCHIWLFFLKKYFHNEGEVFILLIVSTLYFFIFPLVLITAINYL